MSRLDRYLLSGVHKELNTWGHWVEARLDWEGFPRECVYTHAWTELAPPGHRILMLEMPVHIYAVDRRVAMLTEVLRRMIWVKYVFTVKLDGSVWTFQEKADRLGVSRETFSQYLNRARRRIAGLDGDVDAQVVSRPILDELHPKPAA